MSEVAGIALVLGAMLYGAADWTIRSTWRRIVLRRIEYGTPAERRRAKR